MDTSVLGYEGSLHHWSCPSSDSEFYSVSSPETSISPAATVSPAPSMDFVFSPQKRADAGGNNKFVAHLESAAAGDFHRRDLMVMGTTTAAVAVGRPIRTRTRSRNPSKQRQSASEKEKLRMRDLTKALHHLRTYLPASVAPLGQTLTKIETLRLTIRYIDHLSAQLGTSQQDLEIHARRPSTNQTHTQGLHQQQQQQQQAQNRSSSGGIHRVQEPSYGAQRKVEGGAMREESQQRAAPQQILGYFQCSSASVEGAWLSGQENRASVLTNQQQQRQGHGGSIAHGAQENTRMGRGLCQYGSSMQTPVQNESYSGGIGIDYLFQTAPTIQTTQSCQMYNREFGGYQLVPQEYWS